MELRKFITTTIREYLNENIQTTLPVKKITKLFHVGDLDIKNKKEFSLEGSGLSVSKNPEEWREIARLGNRDLFLLINPNGLFLDAYKLNKSQKTNIIVWGIENGYIQLTEKFRVLYGDGSYMEFSNLEEAKYEAGGNYKIKRIKAGLNPSDKLKKDSKQNRIDISHTFDLLLTVFIEKTTNYDGIWWNDRLSVLDYSAPRGVIFNYKLENWNIIKKQN
jgi:hypothetical protein